MSMTTRYPLLLGLLFSVFWIVLAVSPVSRDVWWAENIPVLMVCAFLAATYRRFRFSGLAYTFMAVWS